MENKSDSFDIVPEIFIAEFLVFGLHWEPGIFPQVCGNAKPSLPYVWKEFKLKNGETENAKNATKMTNYPCCTTLITVYVDGTI